MSEEHNETENVSIEDLQAQLEAANKMAEDYKQQFTAVKSKADQLLDETKKAKAAARETALAKEQAEIEKAKKSGDYEQLLKSSEKERNMLSEQLGQLQQRVSSERTRSESMRLANELADGANAELLSEFISKRIKYTDEGIKVLNDNGELTVSSLDDLKNEFASSDKYAALLRGSRSSGGSASGDGGNTAGASTLKRSDFDKMGSDKQIDFIKKGGTIINN